MPPSTQWTAIVRGRIPMFAAADIFAGDPVRPSPAADWAVVPAVSTADEIIGTARDHAASGMAVAVLDYGNIVRVLAGATVTQAQQVGVATVTSAVHPISGLAATHALLGPIVGASGVAVYIAGRSVEQANPGQELGVRIAPRQITGEA